MNLEKLKTKVEVASNVAVILIAFMFLATLASSYLSGLPPQNLKAGLQRGQKFADLPRIDYGSSESTLLLFLNTDCSYCNASTSFYRQLIEARLARGGETRLVSLFPAPGEEAAQYLKQNRLPIEAVGDVNFNDLNLPGTPTIVLLDKGGVVKDFWVGKIPEHEEAQVIDSLFPAQTAMR